MKNRHWFDNDLLYVEVVHKVTGETLAAFFDKEDADFILSLRSLTCSSLPRTPGYSHVTASYKGKSHGIGRILLDAPKGMEADHINRNGLDNRRENLRIVTRRENLLNRRVWSKTRCRSIYKYGDGWRVAVYMGHYPTIEEATVVARESRVKLGLPPE